MVEERLRTTAGLRGSPAVSMTAWRGRSGCRYVFTIYDMTVAALGEHDEAVAIAVRRDGPGYAKEIAVPIAVTRVSGVERTRRQWVDQMKAAGATEVHIHLLAEGAAETLAVVDDLLESP